MIVELQLPPDLESYLRSEASKTGSTLEDYILSVIERHSASLDQRVSERPLSQPGTAKG